MSDDIELESEFSYDREKLANFMARIASEIRAGTITIKGENIDIPEHIDVEYEYEKEDDKNKIEIEFKWKKK